MYDTLLLRHLKDSDTAESNRYAVALKRDDVDWQGTKVVEMRQGMTRREADAFVEWLAGKEWAGLEWSPYRVNTYRVVELVRETVRVDISTCPKPRITLYEYN